MLTKPGQVMGTLDYLAPELIRGDEANRASDVYALGCLAYECLTGTTPFGGRSVFQIGLAHLDEEPPDPSGARADCPPGLAAAVLRALEKDPGQRPASAAASRETSQPPPRLRDMTSLLSPGMEVAGYRVLGQLGRGGMGLVYEVEHLRLGRRAR